LDRKELKKQYIKKHGKHFIMDLSDMRRKYIRKKKLAAKGAS
jgi:hypothetical protein